MLKKTITFKDLDGNDVTEDFWFGLTKAELVKMQLTADGNDLVAKLKKIIESNDGSAIIAQFDDFIKKSYGVRHQDGRQFIKTEEAFQAFFQSDAYSELFVELATDAKASAAFVNGIVPGDVEVDQSALEEATKAAEEGRAPEFPEEKVDTSTLEPAAPVLTEGTDEAPEAKLKPEDYSREQLLEMSQEEFDAICGTDPKQWSQPVMMVAYQRKSQS